MLNTWKKKHYYRTRLLKTAVKSGDHQVWWRKSISRDLHVPCRCSKCTILLLIDYFIYNTTAVCALKMSISPCLSFFVTQAMASLSLCIISYLIQQICFYWLVLSKTLWGLLCSKSTTLVWIHSGATSEEENNWSKFSVPKLMNMYYVYGWLLRISIKQFQVPDYTNSNKQLVLSTVFVH